MKFKNNKGVSEMHSIADYTPSKYMLDTTDEYMGINTYVVSLSEGYINKYFPERAEKIKRCLYTPDKAVINLPVICNNGECIIKQVNVFLISNIIFRNQNVKNYGF